MQLLANQQLLPEVNCRDEDGHTALHYAVMNGHDRIVLLLLADPRVDVNCRDKHGATPLSLCLAAAADVCSQTDQTDHNRVVQILLADQRVEINATDKHGYTPLHGAAAFCRPSLVQLLLEDQRVDVNCRTYQHLTGNPRGELYEGASPLHLAAQYNRAEVVKLLLADPRTEVNCKNKNGHSPLMHHVMTALVEKSIPTLRLLLNHPSVDLNTTDEEGRGVKEVAR